MKYLLAFLLLTGCSEKKPDTAAQDKQKNESTISAPAEMSYKDAKEKSKRLLIRFKQLPTLQTETNLYSFIADTLIPFWYGTKWNFYGTTEMPGQGTIACGYFVTTVLRDAGMEINRSKLAQCASETMIQQLAIKQSIQRFSNVPLLSFIEKILQEDPGLYIVGLDCHTGFLYNNGQEVYFIHASYATPKMVIREKAKESAILATSKYRVTVKLTFLSGNLCNQRVENL